MEETLVFVFNIKVADQIMSPGVEEKEGTQQFDFSDGFFFHLRHLHGTALTTQVDNATFEGGALKDLRGLHFAARPKEWDHVI